MSRFGSFFGPQASSPKGGPTYWYVDPSIGSDMSNDGKSTSTPFATVNKAASVYKTGDVINLRGGRGTHYLTGTITKSNLGSFTVKGYPGDPPWVISGGVALSGWSATGDGHGSYSAALSSPTRNLWVNGIRFPRATSFASVANQSSQFAAITLNGTLSNGSKVVTGISSTASLSMGMTVIGTGVPPSATIASVDSGTQIHLSANATASGTTSLIFNTGVNAYTCSSSNPLASYGNANDSANPVEFIYRYAFVHSRLAVAGMDSTHISMVDPYYSNLYNYGTVGAQWPERYENARELLTLPGYFFWDRAGGNIYAIPLTGQTLSSTTAVVGVLGKLFDLTNCSNVSFSGGQFSHTTWLSGPNSLGWSANHNSVPYVVVPPGAVSLHGCSNVTFTGCQWRNNGVAALRIDNGSNGVTVDQCAFNDSSSHHLYLGESPFSQSPSGLLTSNVTIKNSYFSAAGTEYTASQVFRSDNVSNLTFQNCEFAYSTFGGVELFGHEFSGTWDNTKYLGYNTAVKNNIIRNGLQYTNDVGLIDTDYSNGPSTAQGINITGNVLFNTGDYATPSAANEGIYYDDKSTNVTATGNVVYNIGTAEIYAAKGDYTAGTAFINGNYLGAGTINTSAGVDTTGNTTGITGANALQIIAAAGIPSQYAGTVKHLPYTLTYATFTAADNTDVVSYVPDVGPTLVPYIGSASITGGVLTTTSTSFSLVTDYAATDVDVSVDWSTSTSNAKPQVIVRWTDPSNYWYVVLDRTSTPKGVVLHKVQSGSDSEVTRGQLPLLTNSIANSYWYTTRVSCVGNVIYGYFNEIKVFEYSSTFNNTATRHGVGATNSSSTTKFDNLAVYCATNPSVNSLNIGLVGYWLNTLNAASNANINDSGGATANNLTNNNGTVLTGTGIGAGQYAGSFTRTSKMSLSIANNGSIQLPGSFHGAAWVKLTAWHGANTTNPIIGKGTTWATVIDLSLEVRTNASNNAGKMYFLVGNGANNASAASTADGIALNTWYFVDFWYDATAQQIGVRVNNGTKNTAAWTHGSANSTGVLGIGGIDNPAIYNSTDFWQGLIQGVALAKRVWTDAEVTQLFNNGTPYMPAASNGF